MRKMTEAVKGTEWEALTWPEPTNIEDARMLRGLRKQMYPNDPNPEDAA